MGSLAVLSFGRGKGLTGGAGGALLAHDGQGEAVLEALSPAKRALAGGRGWGALAAAAAQAALARPALYGLPASLSVLGLGETVYREPSPSSGPGAAVQGILTGAWVTSWEEAAIRRRRARRLLEAWTPGSGLTPIRGPERSVSGYLRLPFLAEAGRRRRLETPDARRLGIMPGYPRPLSGLDAVAERMVGSAGVDHDPGWPGAQTLARRLVTLPVHGRLRESDLRRLEEVLRGGG
jgi:dTDP-4-amino-4,6-dideoxygalactose transaminase